MWWALPKVAKPASNDVVATNVRVPEEHTANPIFTQAPHDGPLFRWSFFGKADVSLGLSLAAIAFFSFVCLVIIWWIFRTGYRVRT